MKLTLLGTGNAGVTACYNTCFVLNDGENFFLVDGGGGNTVLRQLKEVGIDTNEIHDIFVTHKHIDHLLGIIWIVRMITSAMGNGKWRCPSGTISKLFQLAELQKYRNDSI